MKMRELAKQLLNGWWTRAVTLTPKPLPDPEPAYCDRPRPMRGFLARLTPEQRKAMFRLDKRVLLGDAGDPLAKKRA
jgi:hypothetical protein